MPLARRVAATAFGVDGRVEIDGADDRAAQRGIGDERRGVVRRLGPSVEPTGGVGDARGGPRQTARAEQPLDLVREQPQRRDRRRVVGLVLAPSCPGRCRGRARAVPSARRAAPRPARRRRARAAPATTRPRRRTPSAARSSRRRSRARRSAAPRPRSCRRPASARRRSPGPRAARPRSRSRCAASSRRRPRPRVRRSARCRSRCAAPTARRGTAPPRGRRRTSPRTPRTPGTGPGRRISPNAATSQNAVAPPLPSTTCQPSGSANSSARPVRIRATRSLTGAWRWLVPSGASPSRRASSAGTFDGPDPNRPSAGRSSAGMSIATARSSHSGAQHPRRGGRCRTPVRDRGGRAARRSRRSAGSCAASDAASR